MWNDEIIKQSKGIINGENIDKFNCDFYEEVSSNHNSSIKDGTPCKYSVKVDGLKIEGTYIASWIGDIDYPDETEPYEITIDKVSTTD